jgi:hypothetical protein
MRLTLKFNPPPAAEPDFALFVFSNDDTGDGVMYLYKTLALAKHGWYNHAKVGYYSRENGSIYLAKILRKFDGEWFTLFDVPKGTKRADLPWYGDVRYGWRKTPSRRAKPMTNEEYAEWRLAVYKEQQETKLIDTYVGSGLTYMKARYGDVMPPAATYAEGGLIPVAAP